MMNIYLASRSPRRIELLRNLGLCFEVISLDIEESQGLPGQTASFLARENAWRKASYAAALLSGGIVIAADTIVVLQGEILGKPVDAAHAKYMLKRLGNREHEVITGLCIMEIKDRTYSLAAETSRVFFNPLSEEEISAYIATGESMDKAGAYGIQGRAAVFIHRIEGCYFNIVGLPLSKLYLMLKEYGINILRGANRDAI